MGKLTLREIRRSLGRFLAIAAIVALGVGFFCGLRLTKTAMVRTLDAYAEAQQMYDFRLVSTIGFDETDAAKIAADSRVAACEGTKSADALTSTAGGASAYRGNTSSRSVHSSGESGPPLSAVYWSAVSPQHGRNCSIYLRELERGAQISVAARDARPAEPEGRAAAADGGRVSGRRDAVLGTGSRAEDRALGGE